MGIYIPGLEMPKEKKKTLTLFPDGRVYENHGERLWGNGKDCIPWKAVPVPPHGRLGDLDALETRVEQHYKHKKITRYDRDLLLHYLDVEMARTIIPAEPLNEEVNE